MGLQAKIDTARSRVSSLSLGDINACELLFLASFAIWMVFQLLGEALVGPLVSGSIEKTVRYSCIGLLFFSELLGGRYDKRTVLWLTLAWILCIGLINAAEAFYIDCIIFAFCARNVAMDRILRVAFWSSALICIGVILCSLIGVIPNYIFTGGDRQRWLLGFRYMLFPSMIVFNITCVVILLKRHSFSWTHAAGLFVANLAIYFATDSRLSFYLAVIAIIAGLCCSKLPENRHCAVVIQGRNIIYSKPVKWLVFLAFPLCAAAMLTATIIYTPDNSILNALNGILGRRLEYGNATLNTYGFSLFGQEILQIGNALDVSGGSTIIGTYNYIDSLYVKLFVQIGIIPALVFFGAFTALCVWSYKRHDWFLISMLIILAIHFTVDDLSFFLRYDILLLYLSLPIANTFVAKKPEELI